MAISKFDFSEFKEVIKTEDQLRAIMGEATTTVLNKSIDKLDNICTAFIAKSSFVIIASANSQGELDVSPKGDPKGFVRVLDEKHIAIPERPGNRRADTFRNLLDNPQMRHQFGASLNEEINKLPVDIAVKNFNEAINLAISKKN